jgi:hypothetical protein
MRCGEFPVRPDREGSGFVCRLDRATNKLTLTRVSPITVYFTDRPEPIAGNMKTMAFIPLWSEGKDSVKSDPPNADISLLDGSALTQIVAELQDPVLVGDDLTYLVKIFSGDMPPKAADVSAFIDIIGRPLTPFSLAGVARRGYRRSFYGAEGRRTPPQAGRRQNDRAARRAADLLCPGLAARRLAGGLGRFLLLDRRMRLSPSSDLPSHPLGSGPPSTTPTTSASASAPCQS